MLLFLAKGFVYFLFLTVFILIIANLIYARSERRRNRHRVSHDQTYRSTKDLMRNNSYPIITHIDEAAFKKGGKDNDS